MLARAPTSEELAERLEMTPAELDALVTRVRAAALLSLEELLPSNTDQRSPQEHHHLLMMLLAIPGGVLAAGVLGPLIQQYLFDGDIKAWLSGQRGTGRPGWIILLLPLGAVFTAVLINRTIDPWLRQISAPWNRTRSAATELLKFIVGVAATLLIVFAVAWILDAVKIDPRGTFLGQYDERNALIVGLAMGFAIIPLIYTLADDALSSVPASLRSASLGAGATHWQTAMRVVIPTAMSGLFSAVMIGLGRAVGETMIVLMAAGGTPLNGYQHLQRLPNSFGGDRHANAGSGRRHDAFPHALRRGPGIVHHHVCRQHGGGSRPAAIPAEGV